MVIRSEDLNRVFQAAFQQFLGVDVQRLEDHHVGDSSDYGDAYRAFKDEVMFSAQFIDAQHDTSYARTFYSPEELLHSRIKWAKQ